MNVTPLALHSARAVRDTLCGHGWEVGQAALAAAGIHPLAFHVTGVDQEALEVLVRVAGNLGLEVVTGDGWAVLAGSRSRLGAFARPWLVPEVLAPVAVAIGRTMPPPPAPQPPDSWHTARGPLRLDRPVLIGILNVTPDSFSDGGRFFDRSAAVTHAEAMLEAGAAVIDVGGESTRPGRTEVVDADEEIRRVVPIVEALGRAFPALIISVDTVKAAVAAAALDAGAAVVNDVSGLRLDASMAETVATRNAGLIAMHSRGSLLELASDAHAEYGGDVVGAVLTELGAAVSKATAAGVSDESIVVDPGFGFSKTVEHNLELLDRLESLRALGRPILVGPSRKRFLGAVTGLPVEERDRATATACAFAWERGARLFRVHAVAAAREALAVAGAVQGW